MSAEPAAYKIVMLGDASVGKTSIVLRFIEGIFRRLSTPTVGSGTSTKDMTTSQGPIRLNIWDTAGEERYRSFTGLYSQGAAAAILVFDVTDAATFDSLPTWVDLFRQSSATGDLIVVVGNKRDLDERDVQTEKAQAWCQKESFRYYEVSAKTGEHVDLVFAEVAEAVAAAYPSETTVGYASGPQESSCC
jgi:small GTP-binding protein